MTCLFLNKGLWIITEFIMHINWKSACSHNQNSKASIKWKMRSRHKIIPTNIKGFCEFGLEAVAPFHRILCSKKHFHSAFNFPTILSRRMGLCCIDVRLVSGIAAVSPRLPLALKWNPYLVTYDVITASGLHTSTMSKAFFVYALVGKVNLL